MDTALAQSYACNRDYVSSKLLSAPGLLKGALELLYAKYWWPRAIAFATNRYYDAARAFCSFSKSWRTMDLRLLFSHFHRCTTTLNTLVYVHVHGNKSGIFSDALRDMLWDYTNDRGWSVLCLPEPPFSRNTSDWPDQHQARMRLSRRLAILDGTPEALEQRFFHEWQTGILQASKHL